MGDREDNCRLIRCRFIWNQSGSCRRETATESGATGVYLFGSSGSVSHPGRNSGSRVFFQFGANNSETLPVNQYFGTGLTAFGLVPGRSQDSAGRRHGVVLAEREYFSTAAVN